MKRLIFCILMIHSVVSLGEPIKSMLGADGTEWMNEYEGVVPVDYLEVSEVGQYINIGVVPDVFTETHLSARIVARNNANIQITSGAGWGNDYGSNFDVIGVLSNRRAMTNIAGSIRYYDSSFTIPAGEWLDVEVDIIPDGGKFHCFCNGFEETVSVSSSNLSKWIYPILLFCTSQPTNNGDWIPQFFSYPGSRIYSFSIRTGSISLDLIPVRLGDVGYMLDTISGELFGNEGIGSFIVGPDKE